MKSKIAVLILAAGASERMGEPKQLLPWGKTTLLGNCIEQVLLTGLKDVYVVLGANSDIIKSKIKQYPINTIINENWKKGLGTSIASGVSQLKLNEETDGILILLADQPFFKGADLLLLINKFNESSEGIVASKYKDINNPGVPAIFNFNYFLELSTLTGDVGAKLVLKKHYSSVIEVAINSVFGDVDTKIQYEKSLNL